MEPVVAKLDPLKFSPRKGHAMKLNNGHVRSHMKRNRKHARSLKLITWHQFLFKTARPWLLEVNSVKCTFYIVAAYPPPRFAFKNIYSLNYRSRTAQNKSFRLSRSLNCNFTERSWIHVQHNSTRKEAQQFCTICLHSGTAIRNFIFCDLWIVASGSSTPLIIQIPRLNCCASRDP